MKKITCHLEASGLPCYRQITMRLNSLSRVGTKVLPVLHRRVLVMPSMVLTLSALLLTTNAAPALALCNNLSYNYSGQVSAYRVAGAPYYRGINARISTPSTRLFDPQNEHAIYWIEVQHWNDPGQTCPGGNDSGNFPNEWCWVQVGLGMGRVRYVRADYLQAYLEISAPGNYYYVNFWPASQVSLPQNLLYTVHFDHFDAAGWPIFNSYFGSIHIGTDRQYNADNSIRAAAEMWSNNIANFNHCPRIDVNNQYVWFGTNGYGYSDGSLAMQNSPDGRNWSEWTGPVWLDQNYEFRRVRSNGAFGARGGGD